MAKETQAFSEVFRGAMGTSAVVIEIAMPTSNARKPPEKTLDDLFADVEKGAHPATVFGALAKRAYSEKDAAKRAGLAKDVTQAILWAHGHPERHSAHRDLTSALCQGVFNVNEGEPIAQNQPMSDLCYPPVGRGSLGHLYRNLCYLRGNKGAAMQDMVAIREKMVQAAVLKRGVEEQATLKTEISTWKKDLGL